MTVKDEFIRGVKTLVSQNRNWNDKSQRASVRRDMSNILQAMIWSYELKDWPSLIALEEIMRHFFYVTGRWRDREEWAKKVFALRADEKTRGSYGTEIAMAGVEGLGFLYAQGRESSDAQLAENILSEVEGSLPPKSESDKAWLRVHCFCHRVRAMLFEFVQGDLHQAAKEYQEALTLAEASRWEPLQMAIYARLANVLYKTANLDDAIAILRNALEFHRNLPWEKKEHRREARALVYLGRAVWTKGLTADGKDLVAEARSHFKAAQAVLKEQSLEDPALAWEMYTAWADFEERDQRPRLAANLRFEAREAQRRLLYR